MVGGGLAGSEAAWQLARRGVRVRLFEMRPAVMTPAHKGHLLAELVCSNSLRSDSVENASGLLKREMRAMGSLILECADAHRVPAGKALAVDRDRFAAEVTRRVESHPLIAVSRSEVREIPDGLAVVATGPLTSDAMAESLKKMVGHDFLAFYDAASPIVTRASLDESRVFVASRYGRGEDYINCPLTREEYDRFWQALVTAEQHPREPFERDVPFFEGCLPVEEIARRGKETLLFGPMKPVGLVDPRTGARPYAVVQLRQDNAEGTLFNMVGFQTNLRWGEQERVFRMIPGLARAEFVRLGVMHRNTFVNSPKVLEPTMMLRARPGVFLAGQITGVEGYVESAATGLLAGVNAARAARGFPLLVMPSETALGGLCRYVTSAAGDGFQPMNASFGLLPPLSRKVRDRRRRNLALAERAARSLKAVLPDIWACLEEEPPL